MATGDMLETAGRYYDFDAEVMLGWRHVGSLREVSYRKEEERRD